MAKTRMKTTPTRMQKDALMSATSVTEDVKKRYRHPMTSTITANAKAQSKEPLHATSTIIVPAPKRTNSISSATSSISHASDTPSSLHSDNESPSPPLPKTLNSILCKPTLTPKASSVVVAAPLNVGTLKNRKVYMITEKCEDATNTNSNGAEGGANNAPSSQKRKMYLIMEETNDTQNDDDASDVNARKYIKTGNGHCVAGAAVSKKLTLYADKSDGGLTQKFEKILPEILNRIQSAKDAAIVTTAIATQQQQHNGDDDNIKLELKSEIDQKPLTTIERLPITLPPKKNRIKSMNYHNNSNNSHSNACNTAGIYTINHKAAQLKQPPQQQISAATPVIVSAASLIPKNKNIINCSNSNSSSNSKCNGQTTTTAVTSLPLQPTQPAQKNINLSTDFLFLMKMLPKLESIPEPHKNHVKSCIEKIIAQNANIFEKQKQQ